VKIDSKASIDIKKFEK
jgi:hypothetical protein